MAQSGGLSRVLAYWISGSASQRQCTIATTADNRIRELRRDMDRSLPDELEEAPLAYENPEFLNSADGRILRIMAEYQEPMTRFRRERIQDTVVFFGSARFRALDVASAELELLANEGSNEPAPESEQPASREEIERGQASALKLQ